MMSNKSTVKPCVSMLAYIQEHGVYPAVNTHHEDRMTATVQALSLNK